MKNKFRIYPIILSVIICGVFLTSCGLFSPLAAGKWEGNIFTNTWSDITFELPPEFQAQVLNSQDPERHKTDFLLTADDNEAVIILTYIDVSGQDDTSEDYLDVVKEQLSESQERVHAFPDNYEKVTIAGKEYTVMRTSYVNNDSTEVIYQDGYVHRFVDTIILLLTVYSDDTKDAVDLFLSSIKQVN